MIALLLIDTENRMDYIPEINSCKHCYGTGYIGKYKHICRGVCFECKGNIGYSSQTTVINKKKGF